MGHAGFMSSTVLLQTIIVTPNIETLLSTISVLWTLWDVKCGSTLMGVLKETRGWEFRVYRASRRLL